MDVVIVGLRMNTLIIYVDLKNKDDWNYFSLYGCCQQAPIVMLHYLILTKYLVEKT